MAFKLKSPAFADQQAIPAKYTGDGEVVERVDPHIGLLHRGTE